MLNFLLFWLILIISLLLIHKRKRNKVQSLPFSQFLNQSQALETISFMKDQIVEEHDDGDSD